jgi:hypothetical protein
MFGIIKMVLFNNYGQPWLMVISHVQWNYLLVTGRWEIPELNRGCDWTIISYIGWNRPSLNPYPLID